MNVNENQFDDIIEDEYGKWTQLCEHHANDLNVNKDSNGAIGLCGVKDCIEGAEYYLTIK